MLIKPFNLLNQSHTGTLMFYLRNEKTLRFLSMTSTPPGFIPPSIFPSKFALRAKLMLHGRTGEPMVASCRHLPVGPPCRRQTTLFPGLVSPVALPIAATGHLRSGRARPNRVTGCRLGRRTMKQRKVVRTRPLRRRRGPVVVDA
jgi:hypothetical protein